MLPPPTTILQVSQKSFSADSACACMRRSAALATSTGGRGGTCLASAFVMLLIQHKPVLCWSKVIAWESNGGT